ncbi:hypothetical protein [uncultured Nisaea sp.]|mgnify:FL=1|uniref:tetratricopeptide repeat-containing glycosyltransferase family protein n=1 Tax=uncultured Nisaea sp. TaxID=538215 RepID=UPI0030EB652B|tara:strand:- start:5402 stop:6733 length:1332 start_codon:yes stop_codon:yes gene_type:complete
MNNAQLPPGVLRNLLATADAALAKKRYDAAERFYRMALAVKPYSIRAETGLGTLHLRDGHTGKALTNFKNALLFRPGFDKALAGFAHTKSMQEHYQDAEFWYRRALIAADSSRDISIALGITCLRNGKWKEGFQRYDLREGRQNLLDSIGAGHVWDGTFSLVDKEIIVIGEQGLGDHINFVRYCGLIKDLGASKVTFFTRPELERLFKLIPEIDAVISDGRKAYPTDYIVMAMSLPRIFGTTPKNIPRTEGYISLPQHHKGKPPHDSSKQDNLLVAVAWQGNANNSRDTVRSCPFEIFSALITSIPEVTFIALPWDYPAEDKDAPLNLRPFSNDIKDFLDTALNLQDVDLVISVDTSLAHLAGAMNKPTWLLLGQQPDWRWLAKGASGLWYDSVRPFRSKGNWQSLIRRVSKKLLTEKDILLEKRVLKEKEPNTNGRQFSHMD